MSEPHHTHALDRWMGDGGMPVIELLGASFTGYRRGAVAGVWNPTELACSPFGNAQAGIHAVVLDAAMSLATLSALPTTKRAVTLSITVNHHLPAMLGSEHDVWAEIVRVGGRIAHARAGVSSEETDVTTAVGTFALVSRPLTAANPSTQAAEPHE